MAEALDKDVYKRQVHGRVDFIELVGVTDAELQQILNEEETAQGLYARLGSDLTDYGRQSLV